MSSAMLRPYWIMLSQSPLLLFATTLPVNTASTREKYSVSVFACLPSASMHIPSLLFMIAFM